MKIIKPKIGKRLYKRFSLLILFILLIGIAGLICINILKVTSQKIVFEYIELDAIHDLRDAFNKTFIPAYNYLIYHDEKDLNDFQIKLDSAKHKLNHCNEILSSRHSKILFTQFNQYLNSFEHIIIKSNVVGINVSNHGMFIEQLNIILNRANNEIETLLNETKHEIDGYIITNTTAVKHSSITIILLLLSVTLIGYISIILFVKQLTKPLKELVNGTQKIANGDLSVRTKITTNDELEILGTSFNMMVNNLNETTVSKNFFNDILKSMYDSVIVTNENGVITLSNKATRTLLNYNTEELNGKHINKILFNLNKSLIEFDFNSLFVNGSISNTERLYLTKNKEYIPVLFSCSSIRNKLNELIGIVFVAHDIRIRKKMYRQIERIRKKHSIEINEAQEKERLRIARELHDGLGVILTGISYYIENNFSNNIKTNKELGRHINTIQEKIDLAIQESKNIAHDLIPILLKDFGLVIAIENLVEQHNRQSDTIFKFTTFNVNHRLDEKIEKVFYRIVQEATNNILKHAKAKEANIQLIGHKKFISLIITDNGIGFNYDSKMMETTNKGIGLISMQERIAAFDGIFALNSEKGKGTEILIELIAN